MQPFEPKKSAPLTRMHVLILGMLCATALGMTWACAWGLVTAFGR